MLKLQCGIQDQLCSAYGGINYIEMFDYPYATVSPIQVPNTIWWELERRLVLIYFGKSHTSSAVHEKVIRELEGWDRIAKSFRTCAPRRKNPAMPFTPGILRRSERP